MRTIRSVRKVGVTLANVGKEFGSVTGRPRRTGWLDAAALRRSIQINGVSGLCMTKLDVLDGLDEVKLCVGYKIDGKDVDILPRGAADVAVASRYTKRLPAGRKARSASRRGKHCRRTRRLT